MGQINHRHDDFKNSLKGNLVISRLFNQDCGNNLRETCKSGPTA